MAKATYEADPEAKKAASHDWYRVNRDRALLRERRRHAENRDGINARKRAKYWSSKNEQA
ncbi:hypothetical protein [Caballeronia grimmiae]|uniref:hypothetical protein n=1 Tax=Caballeronia grimmiae TaxID=1071679 RepID=UPI0038B8A2AE